MLKNVYINGPGNHFPGAAHVLPIIILDAVSRQYDPELAALAHQQANLVSVSAENTFSQATGLGPQLHGATDMLSEIAPTNQNTGPHLSGFTSSNDPFLRPQFYRWVEQKLAFFYQFKDNHIYNFEYEGTFLEEILDNRCILEMCQKGAMQPDEGPNSSNFHESNVNQIGLQQDASLLNDADDSSSMSR